ncbi:MAG: peptidoglycan editing factor PgeF [Myxococcota bacterium]
MDVELLRDTAGLGALPGTVHGFTTRGGGVSAGPLGSLNLARRPGERDEALAENWRRAVAALHPSLRTDDLALLDQVHGDRVVEVARGNGPLATVAEADAAFTRAPGTILAVRVADCVPVLVAGSGVVGVAHAGWRGTAAGIAPALVRAIGGEGLVAAVGPCIGGAAYQVGDEVIAAMRAAGVPDAVFLRGTDRVDLRAAVRWQLEQAGVQRVWVSDRCTATDPALYSHRRDPAAGRSAGLVAMLEAA